ncbi:unnamed protein product [Trichobilharzia regenti]|nr:unnamed protein product [Trichobilharzia regenti]
MKKAKLALLREKKMMREKLKSDGTNGVAQDPLGPSEGLRIQTEELLRSLGIPAIDETNQNSDENSSKLRVESPQDSDEKLAVVKEPTEEERNEILESSNFLRFFEKASRLMERALTSPSNIFVDYSGGDHDDTGWVYFLSLPFLKDFRHNYHFYNLFYVILGYIFTTTTSGLVFSLSSGII